MVIFDCNGVLVDSEPIAAAVLAEALGTVGIKISSDTVLRRFQGRRPADVFAAIETAANTKLPSDFQMTVAAETLKRLRTDLRPISHAAHALTWIRGPKAVASSSLPDRIRISLDVTGLLRFFEDRLFSASHVRHGKPEPDLFLHAAARCGAEPAQCIVVEDSAPGVAAAAAAGMTPIGFVGSSHTPGSLADTLMAAGARTIVADLRRLKSTITDLRGW
ncbi:MAG TPA: HAD-IA family hydrolase [Xanthobacteraceae bacterium]|nr:HAD-IA family hydrolase [Xanthobacteraceae bacterium]